MAFLWPRIPETVSPNADIRAVCKDHDGECQVSLSGRMTIDTSPGLRTMLLERLANPTCRILIVDFYEVAYIDTSGLAMLVELLKAA